MRRETTPASRAGRTARALGRPALGLLLFCQSLLAAHAPAAPKPLAAPAPAAPAQRKATPAAGQRVASARIAARGKARVNLKKLARQAALAPRTTSAPARLRHIPAPLSLREPRRPAASPAAPASALANDPIAGPSAPSPSPSQSFLAQEDSAQAGTGVFTIPPDTTGAVGLDKIFVNLNNNYRVQNKTTGAALSTVAPDAFWAAVGADGVFDPRVVYDPYNHRWVLAAVSHSPDPNRQAQTFGQSSVLIGVSETADPEGDFLLTRFVVGCAPGAPGCDADGEWADFPMLGFNKNWVAVSWNQFTINGNFFVSGEALTLDYAALRAGTVTASRVRLAAGVEGSFCMHPATTLSPSEPTLYFVSHVNSEAAAYRVFNLTGTPAAPALTAGAVKVRDVHGQGAWAQPFGDLLPQKCAPGVSIPTQTCPASPRRIDVGDAYVRSNVVFRGGRLYYPQTVSLPADLSPAFSRTGAQWTALDAATHEDVDGGRVYDLEATATNGGSWYAYPSLAVNRNGDILLGFSEFESDDYADAGYALRLATDAPGTMRDPVIYKEGEDYYEKTFGGSRNRWGDYSHAVVDPSNDRDLWTIQEYARPRVGLTGLDQNDSRWGTWWAKVSLPAAEGDLVISEFRLHGPGGANDEFVEIFNASGSDLRVATADGSAGYALVASDGGPRFTIPNGTVIPARGHFLGVNSTGYSLGSHPAGAGGATAAGDAAYAADIPANAGLALFRTADPAGFTLANRLDAVGSTAVADALYREGAGLAQIAPPAASNHSFYRSLCPGNTPNFGSSLGCVLGGAGLPRDTDANEHDFVFVDTAGANAGAGRRLGAPGPENLSSPVERNGGFVTFLLDATQGAAAPPNRLRVQSADPANNSALGTMELRRRVVNHTGQSVTRLRFRVADVTTFPAPSGFADLRARTAGAVVVSGVADTATCSPLAAPCSVTVRGTSLDTPPAQASGGGFNSALTVTLPAPLAPGASVNVRFLFGVQQTGNFRFYVNVEALP